MSIDTDLKRLADAAEGILAHLTGTVVEKRGPGRPVKKLETVEAAPAGGVTSAVTTPEAAPSAEPAVDHLPEARAIAKEMLADGKRDTLLALLKKHGGESPSSLPKPNLAAFIKDAKALDAVDPAE